jgi:hypothetical protein
MKTVREEVGHERKVYESIFPLMQVDFFIVRSLNMHESWLVSQIRKKCVPTLSSLQEVECPQQKRVLDIPSLSH